MHLSVAGGLSQLAQRGTSRKPRQCFSCHSSKRQWVHSLVAAGGAGRRRLLRRGAVELCFEYLGVMQRGPRAVSYLASLL
eukprot:6700444-Pyramimonas_sp.AAC.1